MPVTLLAGGSGSRSEPSCYSRLVNEWYLRGLPRGPPPRAVGGHRAAPADHRLVDRCSGLLIAFPLALLARRLPAAAGGVLGTSTAIYTIPSLALFPLLVPFTGLSMTTVVIGLGALRPHDPGPRACSTASERCPTTCVSRRSGSGYGPARLLLRVELPLALPVIMAGLRVATVSTVALTTIGTLVSYGGLGNLIRDGVRTNFNAELLAASVLCVVLAVVLDALIVGVQWLTTPWTHGGGPHEKPPRRLGLPHDRLQLERRPRACWHLLVQQLLLTFTALAVAMVDRAADRAVARALRPRRLPGGQHLQRRPRGPDVRPARDPGQPRPPGHGGVRPLRPGRAGDPDRPRSLRAAADRTPMRTSPSARSPPAIKESAIGMGMTGWQRFWRVELPLALPLIVSGLRLALVQVWATATIAALVAGPGLGTLITRRLLPHRLPQGHRGGVRRRRRRVPPGAGQCVDIAVRGSQRGGHTEKAGRGDCCSRAHRQLTVERWYVTHMPRTPIPTIHPPWRFAQTANIRGSASIERPTPAKALPAKRRSARRMTRSSSVNKMRRTAAVGLSGFAGRCKPASRQQKTWVDAS